MPHDADDRIGMIVAVIETFRTARMKHLVNTNTMDFDNIPAHLTTRAEAAAILDVLRKTGAA